MILNISGATQSYLANVDNLQQQITRASAEVSSGRSVTEPSDNPAAIADILQTDANLAANQQIQSNLNLTSGQLKTADSALQSAIQAVESAGTLASQGANTGATAAERTALAQQVAGLQQTLVGISQTTYNGKYIFSGDQNSGPQYVLDSTQPNGVRQLTTSSSTVTITDATGAAIPIGLTAQQIFDARNPDGSNASGNVFSAINSLLTSLNNNDTAGIQQAASALTSADTFLNQQLSFYGQAEDRVSAATSLAQKFQTQMQSDLGNLQDANIPAVALQLNQAQVQQQAALSAEAQIEQNKNLFNYLG